MTAVTCFEATTVRSIYGLIDSTTTRFFTPLVLMWVSICFSIPRVCHGARINAGTADYARMMGWITAWSVPYFINPTALIIMEHKLAYNRRPRDT
ncbi:uncharacterized protein BCR38DRAFT_426463 [Pseudomassariella vexata]|uniref:Uncharacterized protein n=1 Tax=Pseudomassariella vexata TaxID=1141098 RepID=A0A1Y2E6U9_9PEZI|nr:uncharacterized protein BCR38DRAFT_426463 [Pseudomassariella vexata]ORY67239.1 hypothetical protein BCR38DRAFT_426463 [Pseudomassariella vexata]